MNVFQVKLGNGLDDGRAVFLRPLLPDDIGDRYVAWFRDERVTRFLEARNLSTSDALAHLVEGFVKETWYMFAIVEQPAKRHIGNVKIGPINRRHQTADVAIFIGEPECWGRGYATIAVSLATRIAFEQLGLRKLNAGMVEGNDGSIRAFERAGWRIEARLPAQLLHEGLAKDRVVVGILCEHWCNQSAAGT
jgi:ribosomal-protein-alanine N-acetyltransferase